MNPSKNNKSKQDGEESKLRVEYYFMVGIYYGSK
jgi:hypothetical protein